MDTIGSNGSSGRAPGEAPGPRPDPVFVLCMGRSGSTLLRFLLDAHPELACPPETSMPALCGQLAVVWSLIEGAPLAAERDTAPPRVPDAAVAGIRRMLDEMSGSYLARRGKRLLCDKSLGSARFADLLTQIYPGARFLCLYRHPMDVIASGLDACPWGLNGYGFDQYIVGSPGNAVLALARYWLDNAALIREVEQEQPERCHRIRYEDLVEDPEEVMRQVYTFVGVQPAPGVARACFSEERERFGPGDHKIWATSQVSGDSVGRGESVPAGLIAPPVTEAINELAAELGYLPVDDGWGTPGRPADPRVPGTIRGRAAPSAGGPAPGSGSLEECLRSRIAGAGGQLASEREPCAAEKFLIVSRAATGGGETQWLVDAAARTITAESQADEDEAEQDDVTWSVLGSPQAWQAVLNGQVNLHAALRHNDLRYCPAGTDSESPLVSQARIGMLAGLLGLSAWAPADAARHGVPLQGTVTAT
jgi:protein-tyrosine sulfotransferase